MQPWHQVSWSTDASTRMRHETKLERHSFALVCVYDVVSLPEPAEVERASRWIGAGD